MRSGIAMCVAGAFLALPGCTREPGPASDAPQGRTKSPADRVALVDWPSHPQVEPEEANSTPLRIVSAAPSVTEICCALGLRSQLVGRTRYCSHPREVLDIPSIGALIDTNVEVLLGLKPDLVIIAGESRLLADRLSPLPLRVESVPDFTIEDVLASIRRVGDLTGRQRTAQRLVENIRAELNAVRDACRLEGEPRVLILTAVLSSPPSPPYVAGAGSFYDDILRLLGALNAAPEHHAAFSALSLESILRLDPDVIIELDPDGRGRPNGDADAIEAWRRVGPLSAVKNRSVKVIRGGEHYLAGPRLAGTMQAICDAISAAQRNANDGEY
jgi:iron complex transport system substrate-binding protein